MSVQQFCLRWNNHQPNFISVCSSLLHNGTLVDVTLAAEGRQLQAHKIVLSACSSYFQTLFTTNPCQHPIVILKDVQYDDLKTMVDFMYYGEVNVSQEQLPHILKTAEMLKIKGLAEMPTDPANLTKSESKSSNEPTDLVGSGSGVNNGQSSSGVTAAGMGSNAGGSMSDSLWEQQHHHGQHSEAQFQSHHHQQQSSQTQTSQQQQQHHQIRRTPSPLGSGASPATRRKRLRKSSNNGSGDRTNTEEQHTTSLEAGNTASGISLTQMSQMSFGAGAGSISGLPTHSLQTTKLLKESTSTDVEPHPQDDSLDGGHSHVHMQIKPEVDMSSVQQSMPLDISAATTPSEHDAPNSQSSHSDISKPSSATITTIVAQLENSPRAVNMAMSPSPTSLHPQLQHQAQLQHQHSQQQQMGTKRNRVLTRQPRVKRDSDSLSNAQPSPEPLVTCADFDPFGNSASNSSQSNYTPAHAHQLHPQSAHHQLLTVPTRIERHSSEPAPSLTPSSPHLLSVPQNTPFLIKQHSDPLLPTQHSHSGAGALTAHGTVCGTNPFAPLHRQYSHPLSGATSSSSSGASGTTHIGGVSLHHSQHISLPESMYTSGGSPPPVGSSQYVVPQQVVTSGGGTAIEASISVKASPASASPIKALTLPQFTTTYIEACDAGGCTNSPTPTSTITTTQHNRTSANTAPLERVRSTESNTPPPASKFRNSKSTSGVVSSERISSLYTGATTMSSSSFEHLPSLRVKSEELQRSVSSPQTSREIITLENPRSSHCPVIRPGPALGCNFCWNTIDGHGRILRRKTKYHCPECQTNLCIVPCFQEYHERQNSEPTNTSTSTPGGSDSNNKPFAGTASGRSGNSGGGGNSTRLYTKNEGI